MYKLKNINSFLVIIIISLLTIIFLLIKEKPKSLYYVEGILTPEKKNNILDEEAQNMLNTLKSIHKTDKYFYEQLITYLSITDSLEENKNDTVKFDMKEDCYFHNVTPINITENGDYILCQYNSSKFVALFSKSGKFIKKYGRIGSGPGEYLEPAFCSVQNDTIFCFDNKLNKIILYSISSGQYLDDYIIINSEIFPKDFVISPITNTALFYRIFLFNNPAVLSVYSFDTKEKKLKRIGEYGKMSDINRVSRSFQILGLAISEHGYIFTLEPQRFGFTVFNPKGKQITSFFNYEADFFKGLNKFRKEDLLSPRKETGLFFSNSFCNFIHYLGNGIIGINVVSPNSKKSNKRFHLRYTFWSVDGFFLGSLKYDSSFIIYGKNGKLYRWTENLDKNNFYKNPSLIKTTLW